MSRTSDLPDALAAYVKAHQQALYTFCYRLLGDTPEAAQMAQRVFEEAWPPEQWLAGRGETIRLLALAYGLALRSEWRLGRRYGRSSAGSAASPADAAIDIQLLLGTLPIDRRCLLILNACCGLTVTEAAAVAGLRVDEAKAQLMEARRALVLDTAALAEAIAPPTGLAQKQDGPSGETFEVFL